MKLPAPFRYAAFRAAIELSGDIISTMKTDPDDSKTFENVGTESADVYSSKSYLIVSSLAWARYSRK
ncbi:uncharacterized protein SCHCODRAFT_02614203 [Schizophyllum commune H4-8]|uniref:uncharacterized protein n=1 Tax=Schizophyllum commune (strain H4-8 / FGSC 9210) TaxID=578458 RepID=UPI0021607DFF|nr:uncharacterized protein SCHCODRAFT_02614203 [Schizophyllum commune H4-8]KAI5896206.1 hypothetical protein SCHCODRAFT_02614203 [Schizophyllum commune H4-8]